MSTKSIHLEGNLKKALFSLPKGMPVTTRHLHQWKISRQLAHRYVKSGWFQPLGYGYFLRAGDQLTSLGAVAGLQAQGVSAHVGGKTALALHGFYHQLQMGKDQIFLFGTSQSSIPDWFKRNFQCEVRAAFFPGIRRFGKTFVCQAGG